MQIPVLQLQVPGQAAVPVVITSVLTNYGELTIETIRAHEMTYIATPSQVAQDAFMLYTCIMASLTQAGKAKVKMYKDQFTIGPNVSGNLLLKVLIRESHLDTNATASQIRTELASLDQYMPTIGSDIDKFNDHVNQRNDALSRRTSLFSFRVVALCQRYW